MQDLPLRGDSRKITLWFVGPFPIVRVISPAAVRLQLPRSMLVHPTFHVTRIKLAHESQAPLPPQLVDRVHHTQSAPALPTPWQGSPLSGRFHVWFVTMTIGTALLSYRSAILAKALQKLLGLRFGPHRATKTFAEVSWKKRQHYSECAHSSLLHPRCMSCCSRIQSGQQTIGTLQEIKSFQI